MILASVPQVAPFTSPVCLFEQKPTDGDVEVAGLWRNGTLECVVPEQAVMIGSRIAGKLGYRGDMIIVAGNPAVETQRKMEFGGSFEAWRPEVAGEAVIATQTPI